MANKKVKNILNMRSTVRTLSIKCYAEQIPEGEEKLKAAIKAISKDKWQVLAICHNRDYAGDDFWAPSLEKPHYHIIVRVLGSKPVRVEQILRGIGVVYREAVDKSLWENHGVETCRDFGGMAVYLTHETEQAILDGKEKYELEEIISNLALEEIRQIREGYVRPDLSGGRVTPSDWERLDKQAYELGRALGDFDWWKGTLSFPVRSGAKLRTVQESYDRGVAERLKEVGRIPRLCVYIQSGYGMGKTEAAHKALAKLGVTYLDVCAGGTGKYDDLTPSTGAIVVDDAPITHILAMADTRPCKVYRRNNSNRPWMGDYLVVTSNKDFDDWLSDCGVDYDNRDAARSRFYVCHLSAVEGSGRNVLVCDSRADRGSDDFLRMMDEKYIAFRDLYNESLAEYHASRQERERIDINGYIATDAEKEAYNQAREREQKEAEAEKIAEEEQEEARRWKAVWDDIALRTGKEWIAVSLDRDVGVYRRIRERIISEWEESIRMQTGDVEPDEETAAEFAEDADKLPDEYAVMMRWWMTPIGEEKEKAKEKEEEELGRAIFV